MSAHAGGMCMSQCEHWRIHLFRFPVPRKGNRNAYESLRLHQFRKVWKQTFLFSYELIHCQVLKFLV